MKTNAPSTVLHWSGTVLTWEALRSILGSHPAVVVPEKTIVTPLVLDELRARKVLLKRSSAGDLSGNAGNPGEGGRRGVPAYALESPDPIAAAAVGALVREGSSLEQWHPQGKSPAAWAWSLGLMVRARSGTCVAFVRDTALTCCVAGKVAGVRPAAVIDPIQARRTLESLGANILAVEPAGRTLFELKGILRAAAASNASTPAEVARILQEVDGHAHR